MLISRARRFYERTATLRDNLAAGGAFAMATVALALLARLLFPGAIGGFPFLAFIPPILVTSFVCGWRAGLIAAVLGALARWYFYVPATSAVFEGPSNPSLFNLWLYTFAVIVILTLVGVMHLAFRDFSLSERAREILNAKLEMRVLERTEALEAANQRLRDEAASRAAAEAQIRQMQKMEAVGLLTGGIAHDFNNMLAIVVGSLDIAKRHLMGDREKAERFIANAMEGAQRGAQLTARLLAFSRQQPLDPRPLDTNALIRDMSDLLTRSIGESIRLETVLAPDLWATFSDASQLENAVINLCVNSRDARGRPAHARNRQCHARRCLRRGEHGREARRLRHDCGCRLGIGHGAGGHRARLRSVLHHQGHRQGNRARSFPGVRVRQAIRGPRQHRIPARRGDHDSNLPAALSGPAAARRGRIARCSRIAQ